jgi:hypothetical protein
MPSHPGGSGLGGSGGMSGAATTTAPPTPPYVLPNDIREAVAPDGNVIGTCGELTDEQLARVIARAQALVDATTGQMYTLGNAPPLVLGLVIALASYYGTLAYRKGKELAQYSPIVLAYQDARLTLTQIKQGLLNDTPPPNTQEPATNAGPAIFQPGGTQGITMFQLDDVGLSIKQGGQQGPTIDPALMDWGVM